MKRKALSMPMEIIIAVVVLVVIALAVIMFTTGGITNFGKSTGEQRDTTACGICKQNACIGKAGQAVSNVCASSCGTAQSFTCPAAVG